MNSGKVVHLVRVVEYATALLFGAFVAVLGTAAHRAYEPYALIFALLAVVVSGVMVRAWIGLGGVAAFGAGWMIMAQLFALGGPGGDIMMPNQVITYVWLFGGVVAVGAVCFTPRKWYAE
ncbi:DUF6113 family protein [Populibacterium corticicola]|jgi:hypothetical protein|uniref:DUF6113 family protein n=1 Tax=Populibacterium corticicola TaxID=1812826 RepID=A0ABW5XGB5_9MICO